MLNTKNIAASIAVKDIAIARKFYGEKLGLTVDSEGDQFTAYRSGTSTVIVYKSPHAGTNNATAASWMLGEDFDAIVKTLRSKGVIFEHYELPGLALEGDVHIGGKMRLAWFKDPDGNILSLANQ